jgi:glycosyltransferase involved in cell wall biosynthesis
MSRSFSVLIYATQHMKIGGIESHLQQFCYWMNKKGVSIDLIIPRAEMLPETVDFFNTNCRRFFIGNHQRAVSRLTWLLSVKIRLLGKKYDTIYTNGQGESILFFARLFSQGSKWVHHYHQSCEPEDLLTWGISYRRALTNSDLLIACSKSIANKLNSVLNRSVNVIPCFSKEVWLNAIRPAKEGKLKFGYYGRLIPEKGVDLLCRFSQDRDFDHIEFHIWGEGPSYPSGFFSQFPLIHYHGSFSGEKQLSAVISSLNAYLLITTNPEALPIVLLEVMSAGIPWFATDKGGIPDVYHDLNTTRIIPASSSYDDIKSALLEFAAGIVENKVDHTAIKEAYQNKFSHSVLTESWFATLGFSIQHKK